METDFANRRPKPEAAARLRLETDTFAEVYVTFRDPLFRYLRRMCASDEQAADLTAAAFERALRRLHTFRGSGDNLAPWLFRIARSQAIDAQRRRHPMRPLDLLRPEQHPQSGDDPEARLLERESRDELLDRVGQLPFLQQECLALRYGGGLTAQQIGLVIGKNEAATQKLISRAIHRLRESYR
jgi:RNA polymerase sigma-70 factor (ECF subfamily)